MRTNHQHQKGVSCMKLVGELKNKVERTENLEDAKKIIEEAGMQLSDEEMDQVAGGAILCMRDRENEEY